VSNPEEIEELLGAYALDAVTPEERAAVEQYLATHPRARAEVVQHQEVATFLAYTGATAPDGLWDRIADALEATAPEPGPELAKVMPMRAAARRRRRFRTGLVAVVGAVAAAVIVALGIVVADQRNQLDDRELALEAGYDDAIDNPASRAVTLQTEDGTVTLDAVVTPEGDGFLRADDLPGLDPEQETYQLWAIIGDKPPVSLGVLGPDPSLTAFHTDADNAVLAVSAEERGGVVSPTRVVATGALE
jgi:anti-sigma-K factor RskA